MRNRQKETQEKRERERERETVRLLFTLSHSENRDPTLKLD